MTPNHQDSPIDASQLSLDELKQLILQNQHLLEAAAEKKKTTTTEGVVGSSNGKSNNKTATSSIKRKKKKLHLSLQHAPSPPATTIEDDSESDSVTITTIATSHKLLNDELSLDESSPPPLHHDDSPTLHSPSLSEATSLISHFDQLPQRHASGRKKRQRPMPSTKKSRSHASSSAARNGATIPRQGEISSSTKTSRSSKRRSASTTSRNRPSSPLMREINSKLKRLDKLRTIHHRQQQQRATESTRKPHHHHSHQQEYHTDHVHSPSSTTSATSSLSLDTTVYPQDEPHSPSRWSRNGTLKRPSSAPSEGRNNAMYKPRRQKLFATHFIPSAGRMNQEEEISDVEEYQQPLNQVSAKRPLSSSMHSKPLRSDSSLIEKQAVQGHQIKELSKQVSVMQHAFEAERTQWSQERRSYQKQINKLLDHIERLEINMADIQKDHHQVFALVRKCREKYDKIDELDDLFQHRSEHTDSLLDSLSKRITNQQKHLQQVDTTAHLANERSKQNETHLVKYQHDIQKFSKSNEEFGERLSKFVHTQNMLSEQVRLSLLRGNLSPSGGSFSPSSAAARSKTSIANPSSPLRIGPNRMESKSASRQDRRYETDSGHRLDSETNNMAREKSNHSQGGEIADHQARYNKLRSAYMRVFGDASGENL